jgi:hypothetical protein
MTRKDAARTTRALSALEFETRARLAAVQAEAAVTAGKMEEIDFLATFAMFLQSAVHDRSLDHARGDLVKLDDIRIYADLAKGGKAELLAGTIRTYSREGRR